MATSVDLATREQPAQAVSMDTTRTRPPVTSASTSLPIAGLAAQEWLNANRIHVKNGSLFIDPYLVIHPKELAPENEARLRKKLQLTYSINNPSFFESGARTSIALTLGQLIPVSTAAKRSRLVEEVNQFNAQLSAGGDPDLKRELDDKRAPFAAIARSVIDHPESDPVGLELLKNSLAIYLLIREKLTQNGYLDPLTKYVQRTGSPDQVLADLAGNIGLSPIAIREAALQGGLEGVGKLLGLDPLYVQDVKHLTERAATQDFSYNLVEHWHIGRQKQGLAAPMDEKIAVGLDQRITAKIAEYRNRVHQRYDVPEPLKAEERRVAEALMEVDPIQRELMYRLGYEICYSPEITADDIAFFPGIYGLHRKAANDLRDVQGTYRIYFSGRGLEEDSLRTLVHEVAHNLWPNQFSPQQVRKIDQLAQSDHFRFMNFHNLMTLHYTEFEKLFNAYQAGSDKEKAAIIATTNERFASYGFHAEGLFPYLRTAHDFRFAVDYAYKTLSIEGERYNRSGYNTPEERFREVISRFAELKQIKYKGEPHFLQFLAPGLNQIWETEYLPHLVRVNEKIKNGTLTPVHRAATQADEAPALSSLAVDADGRLIDTAEQGKRIDTAAPSPTVPSPKIEERPADPAPVDPVVQVTEPTPQPPKVALINGTPVATSNPPVTADGTDASISDSAPSSQVAAGSIARNANTLAALDTLRGMGVVQH